MLAFFAVVLLGCSGQDTRGDKQTAGAVIGAVVGGLIGSRAGDSTVATLAGVALGAYLGGRIGEHLDEQDRESMAQATKRALTESNDRNTQTWKNEQKGSEGQVTADPVQVTADPARRQCRKVYQSITLSNGEQEADQTTFCRRADGAWSKVS